MIKEAIQTLSSKCSLTDIEAFDAMDEIMQGKATAAQIAGFLIALRMKGETALELLGCATAMRKNMIKVNAVSGTDRVVVDTCGTGGDGSGTFNISTTSAFVVAGAGFTVAKHGNRSISSSCGSADVLEALGVKIDVEPQVVERCIAQAGIGFMFAPRFHPAMKNAMPVRKELGVRTVFNILGPLCNPAGANVQVIGVYDSALTEDMARVLALLGAKSAYVLNDNGRDEITLTGKTRVSELFEDKVRTFELSGSDFGLEPVDPKSLGGKNAQENAKLIRQILDGKIKEVVQERRVVLANAACAILLAARVSGQKKVTDLKSAVSLAQKSIESGAALDKLEQLVKLSNAVIASEAKQSHCA